MNDACQFDLMHTDGERYIYTCRVCQRSITLGKPTSKLFRNCVGQVPHDPNEPVHYVAFWPKEETRLYGVTVRPWLFVHVPQSWLVDLPYQHEIIENDPSYVGTRLKELFAKLGYSPQEASCNCGKLAAMLDTVSLDFIERHRSSAVDQIVQSAAQQSITVPHAIIDKLLRFVIWREQRRIAAKNFSSSLHARSE